MSAMKRKKALAARLICSYKNRGRKVRIPYLVVLQKKTKRRLNTLFTFRQMEAERHHLCANDFFHVTGLHSVTLKRHSICVLISQHLKIY